MPVLLSTRYQHQYISKYIYRINQLEYHEIKTITHYLIEDHIGDLKIEYKHHILFLYFPKLQIYNFSHHITF